MQNLTIWSNSLTRAMVRVNEALKKNDKVKQNMLKQIIEICNKTSIEK